MFLLSRFIINGHSMEPTIYDGEKVLASSIPFFFSKPKIGDIVLIKNKYMNRHSGDPSADGDSRIPNDNKRFRPCQNDEGNNKFLIKRIAKIDRDKYFIRGDNKRDSMDSRKFGWIERKEIVGKVIHKISNS